MAVEEVKDPGVIQANGRVDEEERGEEEEEEAFFDCE
jgi:hypothetical protein